MTAIDATDDRPTKPALWNGLRRRCPNCRKGRLFSGYLRAVDACADCGQEYHSKHSADDGPAYVVILIVAHIVGLAFHFAFDLMGRDPMTIAITLSTLAVALCLWMLPRVKGGFIAIQWANRMHGFSERPDPS